MDLERFLDLSGLVLTKEQEDAYPRTLRRALREFEHLLGWQIDQKGEFVEVGKLKNECQKIDQTMSEPEYQNFIKTLAPPDAEQGNWRLFPYSNLDTQLRVDPASAIYSVKLVTLPRGDAQQFITLKTFKNWQANYGHAATVEDAQKYYTHHIELCSSDVNSECGNCCLGCTGCGYLAVDGEWILGTYPEDLENLLVELIVQGYQQPYTLNAAAARLVQSESVENHSVTYVVTNREKEGLANRVQDKDWFIEELQAYIGPFSPLYKKPRVY